MNSYVKRLIDAQIEFAHAVAQLQIWARGQGYGLTYGDAYRDPRCPYGSKSSKHHRRLAIDFNLFVDGQYRTDAEAYLPLGEEWEKLGGIWGGRFGADPYGDTGEPGLLGWDANHFEWGDP